MSSLFIYLFIFIQYQGVLACLALYSSVGSSPFPYVFVRLAITLFVFLLSQQVSWF